jgi:hypothetical protein
MHTFTKQNGYMKNNVTSEIWSWRKDSFDIKNKRSVSFKGLIELLSERLDLIAGCLIGFFLISCINGIVIRIALIASNVVIVPMLWVMKKCFGVRESDRNT